ncbi:MAG: short-chain dehydrogenase [Acidiferrobacteraceae bacterium]|nr:short-chain dehydrogenase [Acidiferrobacteraceae bacterium]|tara:strand:- start:329 stop:1048 length:720 start_codon:yes stop_codon:yes gene_type:complete
MNTRQPKSRTIIVTGVTSGIGRAIADCQLNAGMNIIGIGRDFSNGPYKSSQFLPYELDLSDLELTAKSIKDLANQHSDVTGIICCAGRGKFGSLEEFSYKEIQSLMDLNFTSQAYIIRGFLPNIKKLGFGDIIVIGSESALMGGPRGSIYSASKAALRALLQSLRAECASKGIRVTTINPGMVDTNFFDNLDFGPGKESENSIQASDIAQTVSLVLGMPSGTVIDEINLSPLKKVIKKK